MSECVAWDQLGVRDCSPKKEQRTHWGKHPIERNDTWVAIASALLGEVTEAATPVEERFHQYAADWTAATGHISSVSDLIAHPSYQNIIGLGWEVVPFLLRDLQENRRFWFPALFAITKVRPFDPRDANNSQRMIEAWISWGRKKGLI